MSTALAAVRAIRPQRRSEEDRERHLRPLDRPARRRRPRLAYAITAVVGAIVIGGAQLGLSIATTQTTYDIRHLTQEQRDLTLQSQALYDDVAGLSSPQYLAANAAAAGMVIAGSPTYLRLSDGKVVGIGDAPAASTISAEGRASVGNALVSKTPLVTAPGSTMTGPVAVNKPAGATNDAPAAEPALPPAITDGLPVPETH